MQSNNRKSGCGIFFIIWIIVSIAIMFGLNSINKTGQDMGSTVFIAVIIGTLFTFIIFCFRMAIFTSKLKHQQKKQLKTDKASGIERFQPIRHVTGLNVPEDCSGSVIVDNQKMSIILGGNNFDLKLDKIKNVDFQMDIDIKQYLASSTIKGIAGAAAFGVAGAVIGSAPKTKSKREVKCYAVISYLNNNNEYAIFVLKDEIVNSNCCARLVDKLKPLINNEINHVEL